MPSLLRTRRLGILRAGEAGRVEGRERSSWDEVPSLYGALVSSWKVDPVFIHGWRVNSSKPGLCLLVHARHRAWHTQGI